jgi:glycoside/pentoside/hexuronide:cation symporter, GPH family
MNAALKRSTVATYALGVGPAILVGLPFSVYLPPFIAAGGLIPVALVGLIFSLSTLWDGIVDPLIGTMIDKRSKGAAPHLRWMLIALLPLIPLLLIILFWGDALNFWLLLPLLLLFYSAQSLYDVAHLAWGAALSDNADDSARIFGNREFASKWLLVFAFAAPALAQALIPGLDLQGRILAYASLMLIALPLALWAIHRLPPRAVVQESGIGWKAEIATSLKSRPLLLVWLVQFLGAFSFGALTSTFIFYADGYLQLDERGALLLFGTFVGGALTTPIWIQVARRIGKPATMVANCLWLLLLMIIGFNIPPGTFTLAILFSMGLGSGFMGLLLIHGMISDIAPHDQRKCGRNRAAFLFALTNLLQKAGNATAVGITYAILGAYGFNAARPEDSGELVRNLFIALPFGGWALMALVALALCRESWVNQRRGSAAL